MKTNLKEKIKIFYSHLTKTDSYKFFLNDKTFPRLNLEMIEKKVTLSTYLNMDKFYFDIHRLWNLYFVYCVKTNDNSLLNKIMEMSELCEDLLDNNFPFVQDTNLPIINNKNNMINKKKNNINNNNKKIYDNKKINNIDNDKKNINENKKNNNINNENNDNIDNTNIRIKKKFKIRNKEKEFSNEDRKELTYKVQALNMKQMSNIINILTDIKLNPITRTFDFDIYTLNEENLKKLEEYVDDCLNLNKVDKKI